MDIATATATELTQAIRDRQISSRELLEDLLARADRVNPGLNAIVAWDTDRARAAAAAADQATAQAAAGALATGEPLGPLHGLPMTVKDTFETEGVVTTSGAPELAAYVPQADAVAVARLKAAGAIIFGKTNTPLYAGDWQTYNEVYGLTSNPWDPSRTTGGSSGGAAAAIASGLSPLEFGSDIGGSIRIPAHYNGVFGLKPSWGVVPLRGHIPGPPGSLTELDVAVVGPLARSVQDLRLALDVTAGPLPHVAAGWQLKLEQGPSIDGVTGLRVAVVFGEGADVLPISGEVRASLDAFAGRLADAGAQVTAAPLPVPLADGAAVWRDLVSPIIGTGLPRPVYAELAGLENVPGDAPDLLIGRAMTSRYREWAIAAERREHHRAAWAALFEQFDVVLAPVMPTVAFPHDTDRPLAERVIDVDGVGVAHFASAAWVGAIGSVLLPVVTLPVGPGTTGLPVGVQVVGPFLSDLRLLRIAELMAAEAGAGFVAPPAQVRS
jgi:amidase